MPAASYALNPSQLATVLSGLVESGQPTFVWGPPGVGKSDVAKQVARKTEREYIDIRALLLDPVDLRGIPFRENGRTRWATPDFLPPEDSEGRFLINLEELSAAPPSIQAALYQLVLDRKIGEYTLPTGAAIIACGNRVSDRGVAHRMPTPLASRFVHLEIGVDVSSWTAWAGANGIASEVLFFIQFRPDLLQVFDPRSAEPAFPCPRTWHFVSNVLPAVLAMPPEGARAIVRGAVGEAAAVEFMAFLSVWTKIPVPQTILDDPLNAPIPSDPATLIALCGALCRKADQDNFDAIVAYGSRSDMRREIGEFLIGTCVRQQPMLQYTRSYVAWTATKDS